VRRVPVSEFVTPFDPLQNPQFELYSLLKARVNFFMIDEEQT
jgi:hypothetical protein